MQKYLLWSWLQIKLAFDSWYILFGLQRTSGVVLNNFRFPKTPKIQKKSVFIITKKRCPVRKSEFQRNVGIIKMQDQLDIVAPVKSMIPNGFWLSFVNFHFQHAENSLCAPLGRESAKTRSLWCMKTWHMRGPLGFGYAIALNWCTKELQGVWQPETQTSVSLWAWNYLDFP